jgi:hypothetical protein
VGRTCSLGFAVAAGLAAVAVSFAQTSSVIPVNDPRPLAQAALQLEGLIGVAINYEDVPYAYAGDMQNVTSSVMSPEQQAAHPGAEIWVPRGGQISVDLSQVPGFAQQSAIASAGVTSGVPLIAALIAAQTSHNLPGVYTLTSSNGAFYITPAQARNASGSLTNVIPALDTKITLAYQDRTAGETLDAILQQVSQGIGVQIGLGRVPVMLMVSAHVAIGANNEAASSVLGRMFLMLSSQTKPDGSAASQLAYHLYYDPRFKYMLNVHGLWPQLTAAPPAAPAPAAPNGQPNPYSIKK